MNMTTLIHSIAAPTRARRGRRAPALFAALLAICACALPLSGAQASTITVGSVLPTGFESKPFAQGQTLLNTTLPEKGANLTSPVDGAIVRWRVQGAKGGPFYLRVLHPNGSGAYQATQTSTAATVVGAGLQTFTTNLQVKSGDLVGVDPTSATDEIGIAAVPGANFAALFPSPLNGATVAPSGGEAGKEIELSAEVQPAPKVTSLENFSGSIAGGAKVTINGTDFNGASEVKFGKVKAASFTATSETKISAVAPKTNKAGLVDVTVTTNAGSSAPVRADRFEYEACVVPQLKKKKLEQVRKLLKRADCKLGKLKGDKKGTVISQTVKPGQVKVPGAKVGVKLAPPSGKKAGAKK